MSEVETLGPPAPVVTGAPREIADGVHVMPLGLDARVPEILERAGVVATPRGEGSGLRAKPREASRRRSPRDPAGAGCVHRPRTRRGRR